MSFCKWDYQISAVRGLILATFCLTKICEASKVFFKISIREKNWKYTVYIYIYIYIHHVCDLTPLLSQIKNHKVLAKHPRMVTICDDHMPSQPHVLSLTEPSSSILRNSTQALQEINLSICLAGKDEVNTFFFLVDESYKSWNQHLSPKFPPKKNKDLCLNEWLLRNSAVHPSNCYNESRNHRLEPPNTSNIRYGPPQQKKHTSPTKQMQQMLAWYRFFSRRNNDSQRPSSWGSPLEVFLFYYPDIRRSKLHRVSELLMQRAQRFA